ncbi:hypothetical protein ACFL2K_01650 [Candidatus Margulisiibacteriota bacterium]
MDKQRQLVEINNNQLVFRRNQISGITGVFNPVNVDDIESIFYSDMNSFHNKNHTMIKLCFINFQLTNNTEISWNFPMDKINIANIVLKQLKELLPDKVE